MSDELNRIAESLGEIKGGLASLTSTVHSHIEAHDARHEKIDQSLKEHEADINMAKGAKGFSTYENVMKVVDSSRPSDHNMVISNLTL